MAALKVRTVSLLTLELGSSDLYKLKVQLEQKSKQGPDFFKNAPLLLDLKKLEEEVDIYWLKTIFKLVKNHSFIPVGITGGAELLNQAALTEGIAVWASGKNDRPAEDEVPEKMLIPELEEEPVQVEPVEEVAAPPEAAQQEPPQEEKTQETAETGGTDNSETTATYVPTKMVFQPVRSGQRIYAKGGDLIVMSSVNTGAEVMADGNIHVYGSLRGRALAGVAGWEGARIFCQDLKADLVAIAGYYTINEDLPQDKMNKAVQISLDQESLNVDLLTP